MAFEAEFFHGDVTMVDHTPSGADVAAGDVVVVGEYPLIAHGDITDGRLGALAAGGGVYKVTVDADLAPGDTVYWDNTAKKVTATAAAGANKHFGWITPESDPGADGESAFVVHDPDGTSI